MFLGTHIKLGVEVAIKIINQSDPSITSTDFDKLTLETKILKTIKHPNVLQLYHVLEQKPKIYLISEYIPCGELAFLLQQSPKLGEETARGIFLDILQALKHIHSLGVAHLDIKPQNIMLSKNGGSTAKLIDFGFARFYDPEEKLVDSCGSP